MLVNEEGKKNTLYKDHLGYLTIGVGHLVDERKGGGLPKWAQVELDSNGFLSDRSVYRLLDGDVAKVEADLDGYIPWAKTLDKTRYGVLVDMCFQMGIGNSDRGTGLLGFKNTLSMIERGDYESAAKGMMNSKWAKQTPARAKRRSDEMKSGKPYIYKQ